MLVVVCVRVDGVAVFFVFEDAEAGGLGVVVAFEGIAEGDYFGLGLGKAF